MLLKDGSLISLMTFLGDWIATYSRQVVASLFGTAAVGLYSSVAAPAIVVQVGIGYIFNPLLPSLHRLYQEGDLKQYLKMVFKVIIILAVFSFISFVASVFLGSPVLSLLFGNQVGAWSYLLPSLIVFTALNAFQWFIRVLLVMERTLIPEVFIHLFEAILFFVLSSKFANFFGVIGVNYAMIISVLFSSISLLFLFLFNCKKVGFKRSDF